MGDAAIQATQLARPQSIVSPNQEENRGLFTNPVLSSIVVEILAAELVTNFSSIFGRKGPSLLWRIFPSRITGYPAVE